MARFGAIGKDLDEYNTVGESVLKEINELAARSATLDDVAAQFLKEAALRHIDPVSAAEYPCHNLHGRGLGIAAWSGGKLIPAHAGGSRRNPSGTSGGGFARCIRRSKSDPLRRSDFDPLDN